MTLKGVELPEPCVTCSVSVVIGITGKEYVVLMTVVLVVNPVRSGSTQVAVHS